MMTTPRTHVLEQLAAWLAYQKRLGAEAVPPGGPLRAFLRGRIPEPEPRTEAAAPPAPGRPSESAPAEAAQAPRELGTEACSACGLHRTRARVVAGEGPAQAPLMLVADAPSVEDHDEGRLFAGEAGELLTRMLAAIHIKRTAVFLTTVLKCPVPPGRPPQPEELSACLPLLWREIEEVAPRFILALGPLAAQALTGQKAPLDALRGQFHQRDQIRILVTYHPAHLLRATGSQQQALKRLAWEDLQRLEKAYAADQI